MTTSHVPCHSQNLALRRHLSKGVGKEGVQRRSRTGTEDPPPRPVKVLQLRWVQKETHSMLVGPPRTGREE